MDSQLVMMALQTCQEYAQKSSSASLTEYEMLMYEQLCRLVTTHSHGLELALRRQVFELERDVHKEEEEHKEWLDSNDQV